MKNLRIRILNLVAMSLTLIALPGWAQDGRDGGGGGAMNCPYKDKGEIYLLEFWEAEHGLLPFKKKLKIVRTEEPIEKQIEDALQKIEAINEDLGREVRSAYVKIRANAESHEDMGVLPPTDTLQPAFEKGCHPVGLGEYNDMPAVDRLFYDQALLETLPNTDQAGFWIHESVYYVFRHSTGDVNSVQTRYFVGRLFSEQGIEPMYTTESNLQAQYICVQDKENHHYKNRRIQKFIINRYPDEFEIVPLSMKTNLLDVLNWGRKNSARVATDDIMGDIEFRFPEAFDWSTRYHEPVLYMSFVDDLRTILDWGIIYGSDNKAHPRLHADYVPENPNHLSQLKRKDHTSVVCELVKEKK